MKKRLLQITFFLTVLCWFLGMIIGISQTPAPDLDSITEDSYRRMLVRQADEQKSDSLLVNPSQLEIKRSSLMYGQKWYYAAAGLIIVVVLGALWYFQLFSRTNKNDHKQ